MATAPPPKKSPGQDGGTGAKEAALRAKELTVWRRNEVASAAAHNSLCPSVAAFRQQSGATPALQRNKRARQKKAPAARPGLRFPCPWPSDDVAVDLGARQFNDQQQHTLKRPRSLRCPQHLPAGNEF